MESLETGTLPGTGSFRCIDCDYVLSLAAFDELPTCPACGSREFARASLFTHPRPRSQPDDESTADWADEARRSVTEPGLYLCWRDGEVHQVAALREDWT